MATDQTTTWISGNRTVGTAEVRRATGSGPDRRLRLVFALAALPLLVAGCADSDKTVTPQAPASETGGSVTTDLTIVSDDGKGKTETWTLTCDPAGGTHPTPEAACAALTGKGTTAMPAVAKDKICTQIYGGPQTAKITGTWRGEAVNASFSRKNGCEISRWQSLKGLLPDAGASVAQ
ncbi:MAG TPA: SSI family serine proteinase inhibitor [Kineosporiaceae bacterium]|nr:SSI family serine proteinase inhibitor [Kineosporiaceae bacterium]